MTRMEAIREAYKTTLINQLADAFSKLADPNLTQKQEQALYAKWQDITRILETELGMTPEEIKALLQQRLRDNA